MATITLYAVPHARACIENNPNGAQEYAERIDDYLEYFRQVVDLSGYRFRVDWVGSARVFHCDDAAGWRVVNYGVADFWGWCRDQ